MSPANHRNNFNFLRFMLASLVIVSHAAEIMDGDRSRELLTRVFGTLSFGELAVDGFFVLSGFLITKSWINRPSIVHFLQSRILRIAPGFIVACVVSLCIFGPMGGGKNYWSTVAWGEFFKGLVTLKLLGTPDVFPGSHYPRLNAALWTIPYEFNCYLAAMVCGLVGMASRRWLVLCILLTFCAAHMAGKLQLVHLSFHGEACIRFGMAFAAGATFYLFREVLSPRAGGGGIQILAFATLGACMFVEVLAEPAWCVIGGFFVLCYAFQGTRLLGFNRLPDVSYGIYLYAWPLNKLLLWWVPDVNLYLSIAIVFAGAVAAGTLSWYLVEKPFLRLKSLPWDWKAWGKTRTVV